MWFDLFFMNLGAFMNFNPPKKDPTHILKRKT